MAIDTTNEKLSLMHLAQPWMPPITISEGPDISVEDRLQLMWLYRGTFEIVAFPMLISVQARATTIIARRTVAPLDA